MYYSWIWFGWASPLQTADYDVFYDKINDADIILLNLDIFLPDRRIRSENICNISNIFTFFLTVQYRLCCTLKSRL